MIAVQSTSPGLFCCHLPLGRDTPVAASMSSSSLPTLKYVSCPHMCRKPLQSPPRPLDHLDHPPDQPDQPDQPDHGRPESRQTLTCSRLWRTFHLALFGGDPLVFHSVAPSLGALLQTLPRQRASVPKLDLMRTRPSF